MSGLSYAEINNAIVRDLDSTVAGNDYCDELRRVVEANWNTIRNQITVNPNMMVSEFNFRLSSNRPLSDAHVRNWWPSPLHVSNYLIEFVRGVLYHYYVRLRRSVRVQFSPNMAIISTTGGPSNFIWASRSNWGILGQSYLIHDIQTFNHFIEVILKNEDLQQAMLASLSSLSSKYSDGFLAPLSLTFHLTSVPSKIFGNNGRCLSEHKCTDGSCDSNACVWLALSSIFDVDKCGNAKRRSSEMGKGKGQGQRTKVNRKRAKKLEKKFLAWLKKRGKEKDILSEKIGHLGLPERYLGELEKFLGHSIILLSEKTMNMRKVANDTVLKTTKYQRYFSSKNVSNNDYGKFIYLLTKNENHVQTVLNLQKYSRKFVCSKCTRCFSRSADLEYHNKFKVCEKKRFVAEKQVNFPYSAEKIVSETAEFEHLSICKDTKYTHCLINVEKDSSVSLTMQIDLKGTDQMLMSRRFESLGDCASFIIKFLAKCAIWVLGERLVLHFDSLQKIETALSSYENCDPEAIDRSKLKHLQMVKTEIVKYLSKYDIYLSVGQEDPKIVSNFMFGLLSKLSDDRECETIHVKFDQNVLQYVAVDQFPLNFILLNKFGATFQGNRATPDMFAHFKDTVSLFKSEFGLNIVGQRNLTQIGRHLMASTLDEGRRNALFSPPLAFSHEIHETFVSYGVLNAKKSICHDQGFMKGAMNVDFEKFYGHLVLKKNANWMLVGLPHIYVRKGTTYVTKRSRKRHTFSNMILGVIEFCCDALFSISHLNGQEKMRYGMLFDAILKIEGNEVFYEADGCIWHSCPKICHSSEANVMKGHKLHCDACKTEEMVGDGSAHLKFLKPRLWKMKTNEQRDSVHALKKNVTYDEDYKNTLEKAALMYKRSGKRIVSVSECHVLRFWHKSTGAFMDSLKLPCKFDCRDIQLSTLVEQITMQNFPLLRYGALTHDKVITAIKHGDLNGFVKCTTVAGDKTRHNLGVLKPFFYKKDGISQTSYDVEDKIVSTLILREMLTNGLTSDFSITAITEIIEYRVSASNPFHALEEPVFNAFKNYKPCTGFIQILKGSLNSAIGAFGISGHKHKNSYLMNENDIKCIQDLHNLSHGTQVNAEKRLFHFASSSRICNLKQLHMAMISNGISIFMNFFLTWNFYFLGEAVRFNTDGFLTMFNRGFTPETLCSSALTSVLLDHHLKVTMNTEEANRYFKWKKKFFIALGVCLEHEKEYLYTLVNGEMFKQRTCCINYMSNGLDFPVKLEFIGNVSVVTSVNKLSVFNSYKNEYFIKCSGSTDEFLSNIHMYSYDQLNEKLC